MKCVLFLQDVNNYKKNSIKSLEDYIADFLIKQGIAKDVTAKTNNSFDGDTIATKQFNSIITK